MNRKKSVLPLLAAGLLTITGCTEDEDSYKEPLVIDVYDSLSDHQGLQTGWYAQILEEKFNLQLNFLDKSQEGSLEQADLYVCSREDVSPEDLLQEERLLNLEPYLEEEPIEDSELVDYKESYEYWNEQLMQEGIYVFPTLVSRLSEMTPSEETMPQYGIYLNWEAYERIGMPDIEDMEELLDVLEEMQDTDEGLVLYTEEDTDLLDHISSLMGTQGGRREGFLINRQGRYEDLLDKDSLYLETLMWLREAYERGLLAEDSDELSQQEMLEIYREGKGLLSIWPKLDVRGYELAPVEDMKVVSRGCDPLGNVDTYVGISVHAEKPERILELVGWLYSTEGIMLSGTDTDLKAAGPQGLTWDVEDGNPVLTDFGRQVFAESLSGEERPYGEDGSLKASDQSDGEIQVPEEWGGGTWQQGTCKLSLQPVVNVEVSPSGFAYNYTLWDTTIERYTKSSLSWQERMDAFDPMEYLINQGNLTVIASAVRKNMGSESALIPVEENVDKNHSQPQDIVDKRDACRQVIVDYSWKIIRAESEDESERLLEEMRTAARDAGYEDVVEYGLE